MLSLIAMSFSCYRRSVLVDNCLSTRWQPLEEDHSVGRHVEGAPKAMSKHPHTGVSEGEPDERLGRASAAEAGTSQCHLVTLPVRLVPGCG